MYIQQSALFWEMDRDFVKDLMGIAVRETYQTGDFLFSEGDPADHFYILIKGRVKLTVGETGPVVYTVECLEPTVLDNFHREQFHKVIEKYPGPGLIFFKRLARLIGNRLLWSYKMITSTAKSDTSPSFGSGQIQDSEAAA
jgi:CRP-like cAMP-binding protein